MHRIIRVARLAIILLLALTTRDVTAQGADYTVVISPYNPPIMIPAAGGSYGYRLGVQNNEATSRAFDVWTVYTYPGGGLSDAVYGPVELELPPGGWSAHSDLTQFVPGDLPAGTYTYTAHAGVFPDVVWTSDSFSLEKLTGSIGWYPQSPGVSNGLRGVWFVDADTGWAVSSYREIIHSTDGGDTWLHQDDGQYYPHEYNDVCFVDDQTGWVVGHGWSLGGTILHTSDGGATWVEQDHPSDYELNSVFFLDADRGWAVGGYFDIYGSNHRRVIEYTPDGGNTWYEQHWQSYRYPLRSVHFADPDHGWAAGGPGYILRTSNGGDTWTEQDTGSSYLEGVFFIDANEGWCVGSDGKVLHTTDGGAVWQDQDSGTTADFNSVFFTDADTGWIAGVDYALFRPVVMQTRDGGDSWQPQDTGTGDAEIVLTDVHFVDPNHGWAAGFAFPDIGVMLHTENGGSALPPGPQFGDGFESGDTSRWSATAY
jgi:photosystem II stability/assembly factor-like uncharacterized protein